MNNPTSNQPHSDDHGHRLQRQQTPINKNTSQARTDQNPTDLKTADVNAGLRMLLAIEAEARKAASREELEFVIANETRKLTKSRQIFVFRTADKLRLTTISGLPGVERNAPLVQDIERIAAQYGSKHGLENRLEFYLPTYLTDPRDTLVNYPFPYLLWVPFLSRAGETLGAMLLAREQAWTEQDIAIAERLANTFQHALATVLAVSNKTPGSRVSSFLRRKIMIASFLLALMIMAIPVPISTLAPMEIIAYKPFVISAPIEGVIEEVLINPGEEVLKNQPIVQFSDTILRNTLEVAQREVLVAQAQLKKSSQLAFSDKKGRHQLRLAMADLALKKSKLVFASEMFDRTTIRAQRAGIAVYSDKQGLIGKPVALGQRIMQIANPRQIEIVIDVAVEDAIVLKSGARAKIFLDSDPVHSREATIAFSDYEARPAAGGRLAFRVVARFVDKDGKLPRLGVRGTAQIFGDRSLLGFYLFRRPLSALRQWIGL